MMILILLINNLYIAILSLDNIALKSRRDFKCLPQLRSN